jgi:hypothetical protein
MHRVSLSIVRRGLVSAVRRRGGWFRALVALSSASRLALGKEFSDRRRRGKSQARRMGIKGCDREGCGGTMRLRRSGTKLWWICVNGHKTAYTEPPIS